MRILFAGGGTGGHLYPGLAIARALVRAEPAMQPFFVGARRGIERDVLPPSGFPHVLLDLHPLYRSSFWNNWRTVVGGVSAWARLRALVREERPVMIVGTGGYAAGLVMAYGVAAKIPIVQQAGDSYPGLTARAFSRFSEEIYLNFPEAAKFLRSRRPGSLIDTGAPIEPPPSPRPEKRAARTAWGLPESSGTVVMVFGGSQGALAINNAVAEWIESGLPEGVFVIWATGRGTFDRFSHHESSSVKVRPYLSPIADAYAAADLVIGRAGAMGTAELLAWGLPSILVPLPTAAADHQTINARALQAAGAAIHLPQAELSGQRLETVVRDLLGDPAAVDRLREGALRRARPDAAAHIAARIVALVNGPPSFRSGNRLNVARSV